MKVEIDNGRLIVTPITRDEEKLVFAMAAAFAAFEAVASPVTGEAVPCNDEKSATLQGETDACRVSRNDQQAR